MEPKRDALATDDAATPALVCIGNITVDESVQPDGRRREALGGDAIFAALAARSVSTTCAVEWFAPIGNDFPEALRAQLRSAGLGLDHLPARDLPTVRNVITYAADGGRSWDLVTGREHFDLMSVYPRDVPDTYLEADGLLVLAMSLPCEITLTPWLRAHSEAVIYLDLEEDGVPGHEAEILDLIASSDVFLPSEVEARMLSGSSDLTAAARLFSALGPSCVVIKQAERGCLVLDHGLVTEVPTEPVVPVDPTGAGDAFCGAFAAAHLEHGEALIAAQMAAGAARIAIGGYGVEALLADAVSRAGTSLQR
jgi:sugar/nucleoside kinase (ribokinase family)